MNIEERILNDNSCSPYVDKGRGYVEIAFKDGAYWGYEKGCKDMIEKACDKLSELKSAYEKDLDADPRVYERDIQLCAKISLVERLILELKEE